jgi:hypothetical protein
VFGTGAARGGRNTKGLCAQVPGPKSHLPGNLEAAGHLGLVSPGTGGDARRERLLGDPHAGVAHPNHGLSQAQLAQTARGRAAAPEPFETSWPIGETDRSRGDRR